MRTLASDSLPSPLPFLVATERRRTEMRRAPNDFLFEETFPVSPLASGEEPASASASFWVAAFSGLLLSCSALSVSLLLSTKESRDKTLGGDEKHDFAYPSLSTALSASSSSLRCFFLPAKRISYSSCALNNKRYLSTHYVLKNRSYTLLDYTVYIPHAGLSL